MKNINIVILINDDFYEKILTEHLYNNFENIDVRIFKSWLELLENYNLKKVDIIFFSDSLRKKNIHQILNTLKSFNCTKIILQLKTSSIIQSEDAYVVKSAEISSKIFKYFLKEIINKIGIKITRKENSIILNNFPGYFFQLDKNNNISLFSPNVLKIWPDIKSKNIKAIFANSFDYLDFIEGKDAIYLMKSTVKNDFYALLYSYLVNDPTLEETKNVLVIPVKSEELTLDLLHENVERLRIFNKVTNELILIVKNNKIIDANESFFKSFKYNHSELENLAFSEICKMPFKEIYENLSKGMNDSMEIKFYRKDKSDFYGELWLNESTLNGEKVVILIIHNLTKWKEYEKILMDEKDKAEKANIAKSDFLAKMSHELRTPLNAIIGFTELLIAGIDGELNKNQLVSLNRVTTAAHSLLDLINDILDLSKIEAGHMKFSFEKNDIIPIAKSVIETLLPLVQKKNIELVTDFPKNLELYIDSTKIRQVFLNIIGNSIKFTDKGQIKFIIKDLDTEVLVKIKDDGIGVPKESLKDIFNEFKQVQSQRLNNYQGTGLGLAITKKIIEAHNGKIWAESELNQGTTLFFILPKKRETLENFVDRKNVGKAKIFIVDDDSVMTDILEKFLTYNDYTVLSTNNSTEAFDIVQKEKPDLIIMDLMMPNLDGYQLSKILKSNSETKKIPIIIMSFFANASMIEDLGVDDYIPKPFTKDILFSKLAKLLENKNGKSINPYS